MSGWRKVKQVVTRKKKSSSSGSQDEKVWQKSPLALQTGRRTALKRRWLCTLTGVEGKSHLRVYAEYSYYPILLEFLFSNEAEP